MALTDIKVKQLKPREKRYMIADSGGLSIEVMPGGTKYWRFRYKFQGKAKKIGLGEYPAVTLLQARERALACKKLLAEGVDPQAERQQAKAEYRAKAETFEKVALDWFKLESPNWTENYAQDTLNRLRNHVFPVLGDIPVNEVTVDDVRRVLARLRDMDLVDTGKRQKQKISQIMQFAVVNGLAENDPTALLRKFFPTRKKQHYAHLEDPKRIAELLRSVDEYGGFVTRCALKTAIYSFQRPGMVRGMEWAEIDADKRLWTIPGAKMKNGLKHIVPLSDQVMAVLDKIRLLTGNGKYVFPSLRSASRKLSENTMNQALRNMGFDKTELCTHGLRATASPICTAKASTQWSLKRPWPTSMTTKPAPATTMQNF